MIFLSSGLKVQ